MRRSIRGLLLTLLLPGTPLAAPIVPVTAEFRDLEFGDVFPGLNESVATTDPTSAKWVFSGDADASVTLTFTVLPATFVSGPNNLSVTYGSTDASYNTIDDPVTATAFDPAVGATTNFSSAPGMIYVWLGGTAQPAASQSAGTYSETITLDASY